MATPSEKAHLLDKLDTKFSDYIEGVISRNPASPPGFLTGGLNSLLNWLQRIDLEELEKSKGQIVHLPLVDIFDLPSKYEIYIGDKKDGERMISSVKEKLIKFKNFAGPEYEKVAKRTSVGATGSGRRDGRSSEKSKKKARKKETLIGKRCTYNRNKGVIIDQNLENGDVWIEYDDGGDEGWIKEDNPDLDLSGGESGGASGKMKYTPKKRRKSKRSTRKRRKSKRSTRRKRRSRRTRKTRRSTRKRRTRRNKRTKRNKRTRRN